MGWWEPSLFQSNLPANLMASPCNGMLLTAEGGVLRLTFN